MKETVNAPSFEIGVELVDLEHAVDEGDVSPDEWYEPASGRHSVRGRVIAAGQDAVRLAARAAGREMAVVVQEAVEELTRADIGLSEGSTFTASSIQITFGIRIAAGAGKAIEAVLSASGESSMQVVVSLTRTDPPDC